MITEKGELTTSYLLVQRARASDSGKYTCGPSNANPSTVSVHILSGTYFDDVMCVLLLLLRISLLNQSGGGKFRDLNLLKHFWNKHKS